MSGCGSCGEYPGARCGCCSWRRKWRAISGGRRRRAALTEIVLVFAGMRRKAEHLARHRLADLFLDTRYYTAHTTCKRRPVRRSAGVDLPGRRSHPG